MNAETGFFFTPGKFLEKITLLPNKRIVFEEFQGNPTREHGHWVKWTKVDGTLILELTFNCKGSEEAEDLRSHVFSCLLPGVYRLQNWKQVVFFPDEFKDPTPDKALCLNINKDEIGVAVKHVYLWLHPGNRPAVLLITPDSEIVYHVNKQGTKRQRTSVPNGFYDYSYDQNNDTDTITTCFHWCGKVTTQQTKLRRCDVSVPLWRAIGDEKGLYFENPSKMIDWHILMIELTVGSNIKIFGS